MRDKIREIVGEAMSGDTDNPRGFEVTAQIATDQILTLIREEVEVGLRYILEAECSPEYVDEVITDLLKRLEGK